jgi:PHD/YefM family antitoxin component YafN of YafNO toxin-antitoxin module
MDQTVLQNEKWGVSLGIVMNSAVTTSQLRSQTAKIVRQTERKGMVAVVRHGRVVAFLISRSRVEGMIQTLEILTEPEAMKAVRQYEAGEAKMKGVESLDD